MSDAEETLRRSGELLDRAARWDALLGIGAEREAVAKTVAEERAAVVAWLRRKATDDFCVLRVKEACDAEKSADSIERGEHCREEEP